MARATPPVRSCTGACALGSRALPNLVPSVRACRITCERLRTLLTMLRYHVREFRGRGRAGISRSASGARLPGRHADSARH